MTATDPALTALAQGWCALSLLHGKIDGHIERALQSGHDLSVREYSLLDVLSRQHSGPGGHLQMKQVADAVVLSQSATTRLVTRLEDRGLLTSYQVDLETFETSHHSHAGRSNRPLLHRK
ncbi:MarR family transcriptional regulator, partial [Streptomyces hundungensis]|uniref:MarR family winged helix-turn-helix transcriptional regulator n=1 Tax=Streptomyces hundungensis TaxID=1077946 RepID=UPI0033F11BCA